MSPAMSSVPPGGPGAPGAGSPPAPNGAEEPRGAGAGEPLPPGYLPPEPYPPGYPPPGPAPERRPAAVTTAAVLALIQGGFALLGGAFLVLAASTVQRSSGSLTPRDVTVLRYVGLLVLLAAAALIAAGWGLLRGRAWSRRTVLAIEGLAVAGGVLGLAQGGAQTAVSLVLSGTVLGLLLSAPAREFFGRRR